MHLLRLWYCQDIDRIPKNNLCTFLIFTMTISWVRIIFVIAGTTMVTTKFWNQAIPLIHFWLWIHWPDYSWSYVPPIDFRGNSNRQWTAIVRFCWRSNSDVRGRVDERLHTRFLPSSPASLSKRLLVDIEYYSLGGLWFLHIPSATDSAWCLDQETVLFLT